MTLRRQAIKSTAWLAVTRLWSQSVSWLVTIILARLLLPADYGLFGMALAVIHLLEVFQEFGLGAGIVQRRQLNEREVNAVFWFSLAVSIVIAAMAFAGAEAVARYFGEPRLVWMIRLLAITFLLTSVGMVPHSLLTKAIEFRRRSLAEGAGVLASGIVSVAAALAGFGVGALVAGHLSRAAIRTALLVALAGWRPGLRVSFAGLAGVLRFGMYLTVGDLIGSLTGFLNTAIIGRTLGSGALGLVSMADSLGRTALNKISISVINQMSLPVFSKLQDDVSALRRYFLRITKYLAIISCPVQLGLVLVGHDVIVLVLSAPWLPMLEVFQIFALGGIVYVLSLPAAPLLNARGRPHTVLRLSMVGSASGLFALLVGVQFGLRGVGLAWLLTVSPLRVILIWLGLCEIGLPVRVYMRNIAAPLVASALMALAVWTYRSTLGMGLAPVAGIVASIVVGAAVYGGAMTLIDRQLGAELRGILNDLLAPSRA